MVDARFRRFVLWFWLPSLILGGVLTIEIGLQIRSAVTERLRAGRPSTYRAEAHRLRDAYRPFTTQHLHPYYLFFFPLQPEQRAALGNAVCSIDADGFREPGPASAGTRKLAVLLGGSTAFGDYASSNQATITSNLNRLQSDYFFVNAGVPSWNSTQELARMAIQIAAMKPALVITLDGANDAALADLPAFGQPGMQYPPGTPENFDQLEALVDEARRPWTRLTWRALFPEIFNRIDKYSKVDSGRPPPLPVATVNRASQRYVANLTEIAVLSRGAGARFLAVFQPIAGLHRHVSPDDYDPRDFVDAAAFRDAALAAQPKPFELIDFSSVFDEELPSVPVLRDDVTPETIFMDEVHLSDRGNTMLARRLWQLVSRAQ